jgi:hypothetical protein
VLARFLVGGKLIPRGPGKKALGKPVRSGGLALRSQPVLRSLSAFVAIASTVALGGCYSESTAPVTARHMQPLSERLVADLESRNMAKGSPMVRRLGAEVSTR